MCPVCAQLPGVINAKGYRRAFCMDGNCKSCRYYMGGNCSCDDCVGTYLGPPDRKIEAIRRTVKADAISGEGAAAPPPSDFECPRVCRLRYSRAKWLTLHKEIADCGWVGSCCRHVFALWGGFVSMPAPECHLFYYYLLDQIVMEGGDERVDILHLDIG